MGSGNGLCPIVPLQPAMPQIIKSSLTYRYVIGLPCVRRWIQNRADFRIAPSQWETALLCNDDSHWLGSSLESALQKLVLIVLTIYMILFSWTTIKAALWINKANLRDLIAATGLVISNWIQIDDFSAHVTVKFDGWPRKTIGHFFCTMSSFVHHFKSIGQFKLELQSRH